MRSLSGLPCVCLTAAVILSAAAGRAAEPAAAAKPALVLPLDRTAYFVGELVPLALSGFSGEVQLEALHRDGRVPLYRGPSAALMLDTAALAPGDYTLIVNGQPLPPRLTLTSPLRRSPASLQDESPPREPQYPRSPKDTPEQRRAVAEKHWDDVVQTLRATGVSAVFHMACQDTRRQDYLDALARTGTLMLANPDTRPTSFNPTRNVPEELDAMSQRIILGAQANGRYPNFGGFCYAWDTCGYAVGARRMLLVYWGWGEQLAGLRNYIERIDRGMVAEFTRRTGLAPVADADYLTYLLSLGRPEFATMIDLPTKLWLEEIAHHSQPLPAGRQQEFERRLDAWSAYLMNMHREVYGTFSANVNAAVPGLRHTGSIQVDHTAVRLGPYFPAAYAPLDLQYQSTWNDQVGGPDYAYQWLFTQALLEMQRGERPTWISNALAAAHHRSDWPGKFTRVAAHGLAYGASGIGFALEGFSNVLGGMAKNTQWEQLKGTAGEADLQAGREFLNRFASLALLGRGDHGVGILFSKSQFQRQHVVLGFGRPHYKALVALVRLGYTPRFVTEEELAAGSVRDVRALVVLGQTVPLPAEVLAALAQFTRAGGRVLLDANTSIDVPGAARFAPELPFGETGKPFNWSVPNMPAGDNDTLQYARWHHRNAPAFATALGDAGRGVFTAERGAATCVSLLQLDGGRDAKYVVAVNDSHVATQADWHQVTEKLVPTGHAPADAFVYDATDERPLGKIGPLDCNLSQTTARVLAVLTRPLGDLDVTARQRQVAGQDAVVAVRLMGRDGQPLEAVVPVHLELRRPDGKVHQELYRATDRDGRLAVSVPVAANVPPGRWQWTVRCQLDGATTTLPVEVTAAPPRADLAAPVREAVLVRGRAAIQPLLQSGGRLVLPIFDSPRAAALRAAAEKVRDVLKRRGVQVEIRQAPAVTTYTLAYDPSEPQRAENARAERGETLGRIKRQTVNANDWFAVLSGWRFGQPLVLLDLAGVAGDNPVAESLADAGLLWPEVSDSFPGPGRAVVHGVPWAVGPRVNAIVVQAADPAGLLAGAAALADLPEDRLTASVGQARTALWQQFHVGGRPAAPAADGLTRTTVQRGRSPRPFAIGYPGARPPASAADTGPRRPERPAVAVPGTVLPKQCVPQLAEGDRFVEASAVEFLIPDLRFSQALQLAVDVRKPGRTKVVVTGVFRTSERQPMWAAQWEDVLQLYERTVPKQRRPMEIEVRLGDKSCGRLVPSKTAEQEVPLEMSPSHGSRQVKTAREEVVTELSGEIELPAGRQELLLIHRQIVDGKLTAIGVGMDPVVPPEPRK